MKLKVKIKIMNKLSLIKNQNKSWNHWKNHKKKNILRNQKLNKRAYRNKAAWNYLKESTKNKKNRIKKKLTSCTELLKQSSKVPASE